MYAEAAVALIMQPSSCPDQVNNLSVTGAHDYVGAHSAFMVACCLLIKEEVREDLYMQAGLLPYFLFYMQAGLQVPYCCRPATYMHM
jgi:hypothetical protein